MKRDPIPQPHDTFVSRTTLPQAWRTPLLALAVAIAMACVAFFPTAASMVETWLNSATFTHGFAVAPIALWLIWRQREHLRALTPRPSPIVLLLIAVCGAIWLFGEFGAVNVVTQLAFVSILVLTVPTVLGIEVARTIAFPLAFLFFAVPIGDFLLPTLMERTADFTVVALRASGVPVYREGFLMVLPTGRWSVVEACSGVRYLIASLMAGTLFGYLNYRANWRRWVFVGVSIVVPIIANWLRAYLIVMLGHLSNNRLAVGVDHLIYGWVFFGFVMLLMFWIGAKWVEPAKVPVQVGKSANNVGNIRPASARVLASVVMAVAALLAAWPVLELATAPRDGSPIALTAIDIPGWERTASLSDWEPQFVNPSATLREGFRSAGTSGGIYIAYYRNQDAKSKVANSSNTMVVEHRGWVRTIVGTAQAPIAGKDTPVSASMLRGPGNAGILAWQWYWVNGTVTSSDVVAKARTAWLRMTGQRDDSASVILYVDTPDPESASGALESLTKDAWPAIASSLQQARSSSDGKQARIARRDLQ
jgi:exosortase A